jgi:hypothetical protein
MMTPTIHLNGTPLRALRLEVEEAYAAVLNAIDAVAHMTVNGRDYYTQGAGALADATREHVSRLERLRSVALELEAYACALPIEERHPEASCGRSHSTLSACPECGAYAVSNDAFRDSDAKP